MPKTENTEAQADQTGEQPVCVDPVVMLWGVYKHDCYKCSAGSKEAAFLKTFDDYNEALNFANAYSPDAAIHLRAT